MGRCYNKHFYDNRAAVEIPDNVYLDTNPDLCPVEGMVLFSEDLLTQIDINFVETDKDAWTFLKETKDDFENFECIEPIRAVVVNGMPGFMYSYEGATPQAYYYQRNLQGDVIAIYNTSGVKQAGYAYDAYGNCTVTDSTNSDIATANAIRYRGYYFDTETNWYFLNARYYSPEWRRFISPDDTAYLDTESPNGLNLYCYCNNDPVNYCDPSGHAPEWVQGLAVGLAIVGAILVVGAITALTMGVGTTIMATTMAGAVIHGAAVGTLIGAGVGIVGGAIVGGVLTDWSVEGILTGVGIGFGALSLAGALIGATVGGIQYVNAVKSWGQVVSNGEIITPKENMIRHFNKHVVGEGHTYLGNNVINYTRNANKFKKTISTFKTLESGSLSARGVFLGNKVRVIIDPLSKLLLSFC